MKKALLFVLVSCLISTNGFTQNKTNPWSIGIHAGVQQYNGELGNQFFNYFDHYNGLAGFSVGRFLSPSFDLSLDITLGDVKFTEAESEDGKTFDYDMQQANLHLKYNFFKNDDVLLRPFLFAGLGILRFDGRNTDETNLGLPTLGGGINFKLAEHVKLRYQNTYIMSDFDGIDNQESGGNDSYLQTTIGVYATILGTQDADKDGVSDKNDKCPGTAPGVKVNKEGCPVDRDEDGVMNEEDKCPDVAGKVELAGCPDSDNDGIVDSEDTCPNKAGTKEMNGCPDTDEDGIADNLDKCPEEAGTPEREGCPEPVSVEKMGKYVYNKLPLENGALVIYDENGVPVDTVYTDENGVFTYTQLDPDKNYTIRPLGLEGDDDKVDIYLIDEDGNRTHSTRKREDGSFVFTKAPPMDKKPDMVQIPDNLLSNIMFNSSSSAVNIKYYKQLDALAMILKKNESVRIVVEGHADSSGPEDFNERLAKTRADRVRAYLLKKGAKENQVNAIGKGIKEPATSNETPEGRKQNRRVEFEVK